MAAAIYPSMDRNLPDRQRVFAMNIDTILAMIDAAFPAFWILFVMLLASCYVYPRLRSYEQHMKDMEEIEKKKYEKGDKE